LPGIQIQNLNSICLEPFPKIPKPYLLNPYPFPLLAQPSSTQQQPAPRGPAGARAGLPAQQPLRPSSRSGPASRVSPLRHPRPESLTGGAHLSSLPPRRPQAGLASESDRAAASESGLRTPRTRGPHAKGLHQGYLSRHRLPGPPHPSRPSLLRRALPKP
jgi:hypothetical protein